MAKKTIYLCEACGYETSKWLGKCPRCEGWDTIHEVAYEKEKTRGQRAKPELIYDEDITEERITLGIEELDRVLGGGLTRGSSILLGGDPGIGKTTLCFEAVSRIMEMGYEALYVSGEESSRQLVARKKRLGLKGDFPILVTNQIDDILSVLGEKKVQLVVIDSVQSVYNAELPMLPGSTGQIREVSMRLIRELKAADISHIFIGHVTKEGAIAGPKILEHMVDTVLYFEGDKTLPYRMIRAMKNRFGSIDEVGIFQMTKEGLIAVENPSEFFLADRDELGSGSVLFPYMTGSRPIIIEIQAITPKTNFSNPRRLSLGYDLNRLYILIAVIEKAIGRPFFDRDIYVNVTGGMKVNETAVDMAVAAAIISSYKEIPLGRDTALFGEIGLSGEIRKVVHMEMRLKECLRLGVEKIISPVGLDQKAGNGIKPVKHVKELLSVIA